MSSPIGLSSELIQSPGQPKPPVPPQIEFPRWCFHAVVLNGSPSQEVPCLSLKLSVTGRAPALRDACVRPPARDDGGGLGLGERLHPHAEHQSSQHIYDSTCGLWTPPPGTWGSIIYGLNSVPQIHMLKS